MIGKELDAWLAEERQKEHDRWKTARCMYCGKDNSHPATLLSCTNDLQHFVCYAHKHLDPSQLEVDLTAFIANCNYTERMYNRPECSRERWISEYKDWIREGRWKPVNVPEWILQAVRKDAPPPEQMSLFGESEVQP
jgi:hypothetical protein